MAECRFVRVILQARTDSARLPAKSLLPIAGMPMACLAARRLASTGMEVILATSDRQVDAALARAAAALDIAVFRGSPHDVLGRFVAACADLNDNAIIIRATGDNPLPDGDLAERLLAHLQAGDADMVAVDWPYSGLPYGVSLEAFYLRNLREADSLTQYAHDREHVTPYLRRHGRLDFLPQPVATVDTSALRATVDMFEDYLTIERLFSDSAAGAATPWQELVRSLASLQRTRSLLSPRQRRRTDHSEFVLGTVQLGMPYGKGPERAMPSGAEAVAIVRAAIDAGVTHIDTARAYGDSERRIGTALKEGWGSRVRIVTKLEPLADLPFDAVEATTRAFVDASVFTSLVALGDTQQPTLLLHRAHHLTDWNGAVWNRLIELRNAGLLGSLGVSVDDPTQMLAVAKNADVELIQFPYNILDFRWEETLATVRELRGDSLTLHGRSALLQGLLAQPDPAIWPHLTGLDPVAVLTRLDDLANELGRNSVVDLCFAYARSNPFVDGIVVGIPSLDTLDSTLAWFSRPCLTQREIDIVRSRRPDPPVSLLTPASWPKAKEV